MTEDTFANSPFGLIIEATQALHNPWTLVGPRWALGRPWVGSGWALGGSWQGSSLLWGLGLQEGSKLSQADEVFRWLDEGSTEVHNSQN